MADVTLVSDTSDDVIEIDLESEERKEVFADKCECIFTWRIENFLRSCLENGNDIYSPLFSIDPNAKIKWFLYLFPSNQPEVKGCGVSLTQMTLNNVFTGAEVSCTISLIDKNLRTIKSESGSEKFDSFQAFKFDPFLTMEELSARRTKVSVKSTLTLKCHICMYGSNCGKVSDSVAPPNNMHLKNLSNDLKQLLTSGEFSDASLIVGGETIPVHKIILASRSSLFKDSYEKQSVNIANTESHIMKALLSYIYSGTMDPIHPAYSLRLYEAAERFDVQRLKRSLVPLKMFAKTVVKVENFSFTWYLENFSNVSKNPGKLWSSEKFHSGLTNLHWHLSLKLSSAPGSEVIAVHLHSTGSNEVCKSVYVQFSISFLNREEDRCYTQENEHCFKGEERCGFESFTKMSTISNDKSLLFEDMLTILCEMKISDGSYSSSIERSFSAANSKTNTPSDLKNLSDTFKNLYFTKTKSDLIICSGQKTFSLHKQIICARSPGFAEFMKNVKDQTKPLAIDVKGIDAKVLELLFEFIYSGVIEDMTWEVAVSLYKAANHYKISDLKVVCSTFLKSNITQTNVCELLAESHNFMDTELTEASIDFICSNAEEVMVSCQWINLLENHAALASSVLSRLGSEYRQAKKMRLS